MTTKKFTPTITRGPRLTPGEISLTPPDDLGIDIPPSGVQKILPYVMGGAMLGMIAIMVAGGTRQLSPYMLMMPLMMIVMMVGGLAGSTGGGGKKVPEINADRKEYLRYLAGLRTRVTSSATSQVAFFSYHAPHPEDLLSIVGTQRQWSRPANADFYAATRIGIGDQPAVDRLLKPAVGGELAAASAAPQPFLEPVSHMWVVKFLRTHGLIHDCPKLLQLRTFPTIAIGGDLAGAAGLMTAMICHLAVFHPPDLLQIRVLTEEPDDPDWSWLKWLPHVQHQTETDAAGSTRLIFTRQEGLSDLAARGPHAPDSLPGGPYVVVVDLTGGKAGFPPDGRAGVTVITLGNHRGSAYRIRVHEDGTADDRLPNQSFRQVTSVTDRMSPQQASRIARKLAGWSITGTILDKTSRVQKKVATDWHQLVGAQSVEEITPSRWRMYTDTDRDRLKIPFGHELKTGKRHVPGHQRGRGIRRRTARHAHRDHGVWEVRIPAHPDPVAGGNDSSRSGESPAHRLQRWFNLPGNGKASAHCRCRHQHGRGSRARQPDGRGVDRRTRSAPVDPPTGRDESRRGRSPVRRGRIREVPRTRCRPTPAANAFRRRRRVRRAVAESTRTSSGCSTGSAASGGR